MRKPDHSDARVVLQGPEIFPGLRIGPIIGDDQLPVRKRLGIDGFDRRPEKPQSIERRHHHRHGWWEPGCSELGRPCWVRAMHSVQTRPLLSSGRKAVHTQDTFLPLWSTRTASTVAYARLSRRSIVALPRAAVHIDTRRSPPGFRERVYRSTVRSGSRRQHSTSLKTITSKCSAAEYSSQSAVRKVLRSFCCFCATEIAIPDTSIPTSLEYQDLASLRTTTPS